MSSSDPEDVVRRYLDAVGALDLDAPADTFAEDVVMDLPFAPPGFPRRVEGRGARLHGDDAGAGGAGMTVPGL